MAKRDEVIEQQTDAVAEQLEEIDWASLSFDEAIEATRETALEANADTMGDGFARLEKKDQLVGVPFIIVKGTFSPGVGKHGEKVTVRVITKDNRRYFFSDGSEGIYRQLRNIVPEHLKTFGQVVCPKGLRASRFHWDDKAQRVTKDGEPNACTFYLDIS